MLETLLVPWQARAYYLPLTVLVYVRADVCDRELICIIDNTSANGTCGAVDPSATCTVTSKFMLA